MNGSLESCHGIRAARSADIPALMALEAEFPTDRLERSHWRHLFKRGHGLALVYCEEGAIIGDVVLFFRKNSKMARVYSLVVAPGYRGRGIARQLMEAARAAVLQRGLDGLYLEVRPDNRPAQALYARLGYRLERRVHGFYEDGSDALRLTRRFGGRDDNRRGSEAAEPQCQAST